MKQITSPQEAAGLSAKAAELRKEQLIEVVQDTIQKRCSRGFSDASIDTSDYPAPVVNDVRRQLRQIGYLVRTNLHEVRLDIEWF